MHCHGAMKARLPPAPDELLAQQGHVDEAIAMDARRGHARIRLAELLTQQGHKGMG